MKDMLSNEHYCYEQYTPLMKSSAYLPLFYKQPPYTPYYMNYPHSFLKKNLEPHTLYGFSKISTPKRGEGSHYEPT